MLQFGLVCSKSPILWRRFPVFLAMLGQQRLKCSYFFVTCAAAWLSVSGGEIFPQYDVEHLLKKKVFSISN